MAKPDQPAQDPGPLPGESNARAVRHPAPGAPTPGADTVVETVDETDPAGRETPPATELDAATDPPAPRPRPRKRTVGKHKA